jgi:hypothetical protein
MQDYFDRSNQEIKFSFVEVTENDQIHQRTRYADVYKDETVVEYQHSRITFEEVNERNRDYGEKMGKKVVWIIDCTQNKMKPTLINEESDIWMLEFEKKWHVESMKDCKILFADFGDHVFRIPVAQVCHRMIMVYGPWEKDDKFLDHIIYKAKNDVEDIPKQSILTVSQDPHGSGKTFRLTRSMIYTHETEYEKYEKYDTFIIVTKPHSAKEVVFEEFIYHLQNAGFKYTECTNNNKYIVNFTRPSGRKILCIFATIDSLMYNIASNKIKGTDVFINLVQTIHQHGPNKLEGPKGRFKYAGEYPRLNSKTMIRTDEATMLPETYLDAFSTLAKTCHVDIDLCGDVQQSTYFECNMMTKVLSEYNSSTNGSIPSFPESEIIINVGNEVRRFNEDLINFRNTVMRDFHEIPSHNLAIPLPVSARDVSHQRGEFSIHTMDTFEFSNDLEELQIDVKNIMTYIKQDVYELRLLPKDLIMVTPIVSYNPLFDMLQTAIHMFWMNTFKDPNYHKLVETHKDYKMTCDHLSKIQESSLPWLCVFHRSEGGKPINTKESKFSTRMVSVQASQGDGRKLQYLITISEYKLKRFTAGKKNIKYESLLNVAISRMKEKIRVFLYKKHDDIWERFEPLMNTDMKLSATPSFKGAVKFNLSHNTDADDMDLDLFNIVKDTIKKQIDSETERNALVDYGHHLIRTSVAHTIFWCLLVVHQAIAGEEKEQILYIFKIIQRLPVKSLSSKEYYKELYAKDNKCIPVLDHNTGNSSFHAVHSRMIELLKEVQKLVQSWIYTKKSEIKDMKPEHAVALQYAVEVCSNSKFGEQTLKIDQFYDIVCCYLNKTDLSNTNLEQHYAYMNSLGNLFDTVVKHKEEKWSWKINRFLNLGNMKSKNKTQHFRLHQMIPHLYISETTAMPVILCPEMNEMVLPLRCCQAIINTLICMQPAQEQRDKKLGTPTWEFIKNKHIEICFVPFKSKKPIFIDVTAIVEKNIDKIADWIRKFVERKTTNDIPQALKVAQHFEHQRLKQVEQGSQATVQEFENAQDIITGAFQDGRCPEYIYEAYNEAESYNEVEKKIYDKLNRHLHNMVKDIKKR